jgi:hypothetical protein
VDEHGWVGPLEWAVAGAPAPGEDESGDGWVVVQTGGLALLAVIDGLGHGSPAAVAAERAATVLREHPEERLNDLVMRCHQALAATRGAALTLALIDHTAANMRWFGIGNVAGSLVRVVPGGPSVQASAMLHGGIVGHHLPKSMRESTVALRPGDVVLFATDGLSSTFDDHPDLRHPATAVAGEILERCATGTDDALVLVARYRGPST